MNNPLTTKLEHGAELSVTDKRRLESAIVEWRQVGAREDIIREGDKPDNVQLILDGFACRYKVLPDGQRQIMAYLIPGDICDLHVAILGEMDHSIATLSPCRLAQISQAAVLDLTTKHPAINHALWWNTLVDEAILREWLVTMGRRPADKQMAHLFCELLVRLQTVGLATGDSFDFPVTQEEIGDTLGLSTVHVNRVLQQLRDDGLIVLKDKRLTVLAVERLKAFADFDPNYLHLVRKQGPGPARGGGDPDRELGIELAAPA